MAIHGRYFRQKPKNLIGTDYDSMLEYNLHQSLPNLNHHPEKVAYVRHHNYEPDFDFRVGDERILVEAKGYFQDRNETGKYPAIQSCLPPNSRILFVFENADKPIHFQAKRKDGSKMTHREWCIKNGFEAFNQEEFYSWMAANT